MVNFDTPLVLLNIKHIKITEFDVQFCVNIQCSSFSSLPSPQSSSWLHSSWLYIQRLFSHRKRNGDSQEISTESTEVNQSHFDSSGHWVTNYSYRFSLGTFICLYFKRWGGIQTKNIFCTFWWLYVKMLPIFLSENRTSSLAKDKFSNYIYILRFLGLFMK